LAGGIQAGRGFSLDEEGGTALKRAYAKGHDCYKPSQRIPPNASGYKIHQRLLAPFSGGRSRELARFGRIDRSVVQSPCARRSGRPAGWLMEPTAVMRAATTFLTTRFHRRSLRHM
jgi:hypothetical protein